jgi:homoserine O-acetyltransferase
LRPTFQSLIAAMPPELGILEREITHIRGARAVLIPFSPETRGHGFHTMAALWKAELTQLLRESAKRGAAAGGS